MTHARRHDELEGRIDPRLLLPACVLAALGVVMVASSSIAMAEAQTGDPWYFLDRHLVFLAAGIVAGWLFTRIELSRLEAVGQTWLWLGLVLLLLVFVPGLGRTVNGATRWINLGFLVFKAVYWVKFLLVLYIACYMVLQYHALMLSFFGDINHMFVFFFLLGLF